MRLGPYQIVSLVGAGGMGEVYKARDTRLGRTVAIKVLPPHVAADPRLRSRFEREAHAISRLSHPHICTLYDIGEQDGLSFLVMEYLEGETLAGRLARGPLGPDEAVGHATEVARALREAHEQGVVHRDLKPANIVLTRGGVKLLDFGIAALHARYAEEEAPTATAPSALTAEGAIIGTLQYMAPEQLQGKPADARTDIFAFGLVLYEMVAGRKAFMAPSRADLIAAILEHDPPPLSLSRRPVPAPLEAVVKRCLAKEPADRWPTARDLTAALERVATDGIAAAAGSHGVATTPAPESGGRAVRQARWPAYVVSAAALAGVAALSFWFGRRPAAPPPAVHLTVIAPAGTAAADPGGLLGPPVVAPDGSALAIALKTGDTPHLYVRRLDSDKLVRLEETRGAIFPFWSPDSRQIGFFADGKLKKISAGGGAPVVLCAAAQSRGGTWGRGGTIVFGVNYRGTFRVPESGGEPMVVTTLDAEAGENSHRYPVFLPDGTRFLYFARTRDLERRAVYLDSLDRQQPRKRLLVADGQFALGLDPHSGQHFLLTRQAGAIVAQRFDVAAGELTGEPRRVSSTAGQVTVSDTGVLVIRAHQTDLTRLVWYDRSGRERGVVGPEADYWQMALSSDGRHVAVTRHDALSGYFAVWLASPAQGLLRALSDTSRPSLNPVWAPGDRAVYYYEMLGQVVYRRALEPGPGEMPLVEAAPPGARIRDVSPDGRHMLGERWGPGDTIKLVWSARGAREWRSLAGDGSREEHPRFSSDGRWVAYDSNQSGTKEVYVVAFPDGREDHRVSAGGGREPLWRRDGKELFYVSTDDVLMSVKMSAGSPAAAAPEALFRIALRQASEGPMYGVTPDGERFLAITGKQADASGVIEIILNWPSLSARGGGT